MFFGVHQSGLLLCNVPQGQDGISMDSCGQRCSCSAMYGQYPYDWLKAAGMASITQNLQEQDDVLGLIFSKSFCKEILDGLWEEVRNNDFAALSFRYTGDRRDSEELLLSFQQDKWPPRRSVWKSWYHIQGGQFHAELGFPVFYFQLPKPRKNNVQCVSFSYPYYQQRNVLWDFPTLTRVMASVFAVTMWMDVIKAWAPSATLMSFARNFSLMNLRATWDPMKGMASSIHCLKHENGMSSPVYGCFHMVSSFKHIKWSPVNRLGSILAPEHFQIFTVGFTEKLNEL